MMGSAACIAIGLEASTKTPCEHEKSRTSPRLGEQMVKWMRLMPLLQVSNLVTGGRCAYWNEGEIHVHRERHVTKVNRFKQAGKHTSAVP